jgi:hypothetical protein
LKRLNNSASVYQGIQVRYDGVYRNEADILRSNLQSLAERCQHVAGPPDRLSAGLMLSPLTNPDSHHQAVYPILCLTVTQLYTPMDVRQQKETEEMGNT